MKYGLRVIYLGTDPSVIKSYETTGWIKTDRGVERWGIPHNIYTDINEACRKLPTAYDDIVWLVEEIKD